MSWPRLKQRDADVLLEARALGRIAAVAVELHVEVSRLLEEVQRLVRSGRARGLAAGAEQIFLGLRDVSGAAVVVCQHGLEPGRVLRHQTLERLADAPMQLVAHGLEDRLVGDLLDQRVLERPSVLAASARLDEARGSELHQYLRGGLVEHLLEHGNEKALAHHRGGLEHLPLRALQGVDAGHQRVAHGAGNHHVVNALGRDQHAVAQLRGAFVDQGADDLLGEEGVPRDSLADRVARLAGKPPAAEEVLDQGAGLAGVEGSERDLIVVPGVMLPATPADALRSRLVSGTEDQDEADRMLGCEREQCLQHLERGEIAPVQVVEGDHERRRARPRP